MTAFQKIALITMATNSSMQKTVYPSIQLSENLPAPPKLNYIIPSSFSRQLADVPPSEHGCYEGTMTFIGSCCGFLRAYLPCCCFCCPNPYITVPQGTAGIMTKFGKAYKIVDPGLYFINQITEELHLVDIKIKISDVPRQMVMTKDNVSVDIDSVVYWHIMDPFVAMFHVQNVSSALMERTMTTLRDTIGAHTLQNVIENREVLAAEIRKIIDEIARSWGVVVESILIKDLKFSAELQDTLAAAAKQQRLGESKVISAKAEVQAAKLMREASDILNTPAAMQIRYLETLSAMAHQAGTKVIFMPADSESGMNKMVKAFSVDKGEQGPLYQLITILLD
eukprot:TRINITY_DN530_c0_g1_i1.p1 TRINITY_DN530_c0_g1~~TRINITY_DN530_c0_g1_i1.p1  ORF type:complete len:338 (-),score=19.52 TRINITY_DN530_c0_g1_i1:63-1076(-)